MHRNSNRGYRWGVILAGGDGTRLRALTTSILDHERPKGGFERRRGGREFGNSAGCRTQTGRSRIWVTALFEHDMNNPWVTAGSCNHCGLVLSAS